METFAEHYDSLMKALARYNPQADLDIINRAIEFADNKHRNQKRKDGSPYIIHPLAVAEIVAETGLDTEKAFTTAFCPPSRARRCLRYTSNFCLTRCRTRRTTTP